MKLSHLVGPPSSLLLFFLDGGGVVGFVVQMHGDYTVTYKVL